jgi:hypothetical protein
MVGTARPQVGADRRRGGDRFGERRCDGEVVTPPGGALRLDGGGEGGPFALPAGTGPPSVPDRADAPDDPHPE